jgi:hypothetical protein
LKLAATACVRRRPFPTVGDAIEFERRRVACAAGRHDLFGSGELGIESKPKTEYRNRYQDKQI